MRRPLRVHPGESLGPVTRIEVEISRPTPSVLALAYELTGRTSALRIPGPAPPARTDGLWRRTCFEAFLRASDRDAYVELNFSPSSQWAAYQFTDYRAGIEPIDSLAGPRIGFDVSPEALRLTTAIDFSNLPELASASVWRLGLSAVIEDASGSIFHWALAHPPGKPDFHHPEGFACQVRAPEDA